MRVSHSRPPFGQGPGINDSSFGPSFRDQPGREPAGRPLVRFAAVVAPLLVVAAVVVWLTLR